MKSQLLALIAFAALAACETAEGFGQDVSSGGEAIQDTAQDVQNDI